MSIYYTILTNLGAALHANAQVMQTTVPWTHMCLGDGGGAPVVPVQTQTALKREVHRLPITDIAQHPDNPNWLIVEAVVPSDVGGWTVRETAIYGGANGAQCIAVGNYPETYKPVLAEGATREMVMRMVVEISSTATVKLSIDPAVAIASRAWVESLVATPQKRGLVKLATVEESKEGVRPDVAVTPEGMRLVLDERFGEVGEEIGVLEAQMARLPLDTNWIDKTSLRAFNTTFTNPYDFDLQLSIVYVSVAAGVFQVEGVQKGSRLVLSNSYASVANTGDTLCMTIGPRKTYRLQSPNNCVLGKWSEKVKVI